MLQKWKVFIIVLIYTNDVNTDCSDYERILLLPTTYKMLSDIHL